MLLPTASAVVVMAVLVQWNLSRGFYSYINLLDQERVTELASRFAARYEQEGSWAWARDEAQWRQATRPNRHDLRPRHASVPGPGAHKGNGPPPANRRPGGPPPPPPPGGPGPRGALADTDTGPRISLFDADRNWVAGRSQKIRDSDFQLPVRLDSQIIGWLTTMPIERLDAIRDVNFLAQQSRSFVFISAALLAVTSILAWFLARHLTRPLTALTHFVRRLASGDYASQTNVKGRDEIADLATNLNSLANTLQSSLNARQRWIADISHELRTPLAILQGEVEALQDGVRELDQRSIASIHTEVVQLGKLVNDLHELSMSDSGALTYQFGSTDLGALLQQSVENFSLRFEQRALAVNLTVAQSEPLLILGDERRLVQLIGNILENSLRYTDPEGRLEVSARARDGNAVLEFADTAPSVAPEQCQKLFERLYRYEQSRTRESGGSGLGLAIARNIVDAHQGNIQARPSALGGLLITISIPLMPG